MVPCVLGGQSPPGRVGGDISLFFFFHGEVLGSEAEPPKFPHILGAHRMPGIRGEDLAMVHKRPTHEPSVKSVAPSGEGALCEALVTAGLLGRGSREEGGRRDMIWAPRERLPSLWLKV